MNSLGKVEINDLENIRLKINEIVDFINKMC